LWHRIVLGWYLGSVDIESRNTFYPQITQMTADFERPKASNGAQALKLFARVPSAHSLFLSICEICGSTCLSNSLQPALGKARVAMPHLIAMRRHVI
jgi:hypothetical protein